MFSLDLIQRNMFRCQGTKPGRIVQVAPFGFENVNGFDVFFNVEVNAGELVFEILNLILHDEHAETDQTGKGNPEA